MLGVYKFEWKFRYGIISGIFLSDDKDIEILENSGISISFGELLGKCSEVEVSIGPNDFTLVTNDQDMVEMLRSMGLTKVGYNPLDYKISDSVIIPDYLDKKYPKVDWHELTVDDYLSYLRDNYDNGNLVFNERVY